MRYLPLAALLLGLASCATEDEDAAPEYQKVHTVVPQPDVDVVPEGEHLQYMAYCLAEERALSGWLSSRSEAWSTARGYESEHPGRSCTVLWRQDPSQKMQLKHPKG